MNIKKVLKEIDNRQYNTKEVFYYYEITLSQMLTKNVEINLYDFIIRLIFNIFYNNESSNVNTEYDTAFHWYFTAEQIITYAILVFYDLNDITIENFLRQFETEMKLYSTSNAETRLEKLIENKKINYRRF